MKGNYRVEYILKYVYYDSDGNSLHSTDWVTIMVKDIEPKDIPAYIDKHGRKCPEYCQGLQYMVTGTEVRGIFDAVTGEVVDIEEDKVASEILEQIKDSIKQENRDENDKLLPEG